MKHVTTLVELDLTSLNGNAFALMGGFSAAAKKQGVPKEEIDAVLKDCQSSDYDHLLQVLIANTQ